MSRISRGSFRNGPGPPPEAVPAGVSDPRFGVVAMGDSIVTSGSIVPRIVQDSLSDILTYEWIWGTWKVESSWGDWRTEIYIIDNKKKI